MINKLKNKLDGDVHLKELLTGSAITFVLKFIGIILSYFVLYLISKKNGPEGVGIYNLFNQSLLVISTILSFGLNISVLRYVGQFNDNENKHKIHQLNSHLIKYIVPSTLVVGLLLFLFANFISAKMGEPKGYITIIQLLALALPFFTLNQIYVEFIRGLKKLHISELVRSVIRPIIIVIVMFAFWNKDLNNYELIIIVVLGILINFAISISTVWRYLKMIPKNISTNFSSKEISKTSIPMMITSVSNSLRIAIPLFVLNHYYSEKIVGYYSVTFSLTQIISFIIIILNSIGAPKYSELYWQNKKNELKILIRQSAKILFWAGLFCSIMLFLLKDYILGLFGVDYINFQTTIVLSILLLAQFVNTASGSVGILLNMSGHQTVFRKINLIGLIVTVLISMILIPFTDMVGAAIAFAIGSICINVVSSLYVKKKIDITTFYIPIK